MRKLLILSFLVLSYFSYADSKPQKPFRTFITLQRYHIENNGNPRDPISNVKLVLLWPGSEPMTLPEFGEKWPIGNGQVQEIDRHFEVPAQAIQEDGFKFTVQMHRTGATFMPCEFEVTQLSQFNRVYICKTDPTSQENLPPEKRDLEGIQLRVFTDLNAAKKEIPLKPIALKTPPKDIQ